jgi:tRNA-dihydrouridine synthase
MREYLKASVEYFGEERACPMMRSRLGWFVKGLKNNAGFRESLRHLSSYQEAAEKIDSYFNMLITQQHTE